MTPRQKTTIVGFGDSITLASRQPENKKWLNLLGTQLTQEFPGCAFEMVNAGVGGNTSREGLARIDRDVIPHAPDYVLVQFGGNDATRDETRHVPLDEFGSNLEAIRQRIAESTSAQIVLLTFPPVIEEWHAYGNDPFYKERGGQDTFIERYRERSRSFAQAHGFPIADISRTLRSAAGEHDVATYILPDGVHLTAEGNRVVAETIHDVLVLIMSEADR